MIAPVLAIASAELRIALRNRWVVTAVILMTAFGLVLALAGSAPGGTVGADRLAVTVASLATLSVYLVPLIALLLSYDAIAGETERGTLPLLLSYPVSRGEILFGKLVAQTAVVALAIFVGFGVTAAAVWMAGAASAASLASLGRLYVSAVVLGGAFIAAGLCLSAVARHTATAASVAIAVWIVAVVLFDVALLGALVADNGGFFTKHVFPVLLVAGPTDAFRLFNLAALDTGLQGEGIAAAGSALQMPPWAAGVSLLGWPVVLVALAFFAFRRCDA
jgi:Cu-processing system permease protein